MLTIKNVVKKCVLSLGTNTTKEEFEEWLAFDNARIRESEPRQAATSQL